MEPGAIQSFISNGYARPFLIGDDQGNVCRKKKQAWWAKCSVPTRMSFYDERLSPLGDSFGGAAKSFAATIRTVRDLARAGEANFFATLLAA